MPFLTTSAPSFLKIDGEVLDHIPFRIAQKAYHDRIKNIGNTIAKFDLSKDETILYFDIASIKEILHFGNENIVIRFGCESAADDYRHLTAIMCSMNSGQADITGPKYYGSNVNTGSSTLITDEKDWKVKEANYKERRDKLIEKLPGQFGNEPTCGISHPITEFNNEWYKKAVDFGMTKVALHFIVFPDYTSLAYADAKIEIKLLADEEVYDQGNRCCP